MTETEKSTYCHRCYNEACTKLCVSTEGEAANFAWVFGKNRAQFQEIWVLKEHISLFGCFNKWKEEHPGRRNDKGQRMEYLARAGSDDLARWQGAWG